MAAPTVWSHSYLNIANKNVLAHQHESTPGSHLVVYSTGLAAWLAHILTLLIQRLTSMRAS